MKRGAIFFTSAVLLILSDGSASHTEVFPLRVGLHYIYDFYQYSYTRDLVYVETRTDSGNVEYVILDSTHVNDTTIIWLVHQRRQWLHHYHNSAGGDSLYWIVDSIEILLTEFTTGRHELRCSSVVWAFPLTWSGIVTAPVFRYSDSSHVLATYTLMPPRPCGGNYDSAWFSADSAFYRRESAGCFEGGITGGRGSTSIKLQSPPVVHVYENPVRSTVFELAQNYPNPFNPTTRINFRIQKPSHVLLSVYDVLGRRVAVLVSEHREPGSYEVNFNAQGFATGLYFYQLQADGLVQVRKMILLE